MFALEVYKGQPIIISIFPYELNTRNFLNPPSPIFMTEIKIFATNVNKRRNGLHVVLLN